jgi:hypothetical protein
MRQTHQKRPPPHYYCLKCGWLSWIPYMDASNGFCIECGGSLKSANVVGTVKACAPCGATGFLANGKVCVECDRGWLLNPELRPKQ